MPILPICIPTTPTQQWFPVGLRIFFLFKASICLSTGPVYKIYSTSTKVCVIHQKVQLFKTEVFIVVAGIIVIDEHFKFLNHIGTCPQS